MTWQRALVLVGGNNTVYKRGYIMRSINESFYNSKRWRNTAKYVMSYYGGLCQSCLDQGVINPAKIVHHKIHLNKYNVTDDSIAYGFDNLIPLCLDCHNKIHGKNTSQTKRYTINQDGTVDIIPPYQK